MKTDTNLKTNLMANPTPYVKKCFSYAEAVNLATMAATAWANGNSSGCLSGADFGQQVAQAWLSTYKTAMQAELSTPDLSRHQSAPDVVVTGCAPLSVRIECRPSTHQEKLSQVGAES